MLKDTSPASGGSHLTRSRRVLKGIAGVLAAGGGLAAAPQLESTDSAVERVITKGRIRQYQEYVAHYHTGGLPGRNEIDDTQEINYPAVIRAIAETGYEGYVGLEFIPTRDPIQSLREAARICDV